MNIPDCLRLDKKQTALLEQWVKEVITPNLPEESEDCSGASLATFEIFTTGLGDVINVKACGKKLCLSYDDDGELIGY